MKNSKLILGTVQMGLSYGINNTIGKPTTNQAHEILMKAHNSQIGFLDTAEAYGNAHQIIGDFHRKNVKTTFEVITKISDTLIVNIQDKVSQYLIELCVDHLFCLMFHSFNAYIQNKKIIPTLMQMKGLGKIQHIGVSIYNNNEFEQVINDQNIDLIQLPFNILDNNYLRGELIAEAKRKNKIIHTRSAFLQGLFFKNPSDKEPIVVALNTQLKQIKKLTDEYKIPVTALALGYCMYQNNIDNILIGVDSIEQLKINLETQNYTISESIIRKIDNIRTDNIDLLNPSLWN